MGTLRIKRVYEAPSPEDGVRVLADRLWPRGIKKENLVHDVWAKEITPSKELRTLYHHGELPFEGFSEAYVEELTGREEALAFAKKCKEWLEKGNVTLLYAAKNTEQNHALVLREWLLRTMSK